MKLELVWWPEASVAVTVTVVVPIGNAEPEAGEHTYATSGQLSETVGAKATWAVDWPESGEHTILAGQTTTGGVLSTTVTDWVAVA